MSVCAYNVRVYASAWAELDQPNMHVGMAVSAALPLPLYIVYICLHRHVLIFRLRRWTHFGPVGIDFDPLDPFWKTHNRHCAFLDRISRGRRINGFEIPFPSPHKRWKTGAFPDRKITSLWVHHWTSYIEVKGSVQRVLTKMQYRLIHFIFIR